jgi:hypothetical protein
VAAHAEGRWRVRRPLWQVDAEDVEAADYPDDWYDDCSSWCCSWCGADGWICFDEPLEATPSVGLGLIGYALSKTARAA